jgi:hypothetical protein
MGYAIRIRTNDKGAPTTLATKPTLAEARSYCSQRLLRVAGTREEILSDLAAGELNVYDARHTNYISPGF